MSIKITVGGDISMRCVVLGFTDGQNSISIGLLNDFDPPFPGRELDNEQLVSLINFLIKNVSFGDKKMLADYAKQLEAK